MKTKLATTSEAKLFLRASPRSLNGLSMDAFDNRRFPRRDIRIFFDEALAASKAARPRPR